MRELNAAILLTCLLLAGCGGEPAPPSPEEQAAAAAAEAEAKAVADAEMAASVSAEIRVFFDAYAESIRTRNWRGTLDMYSDDPRFYWVEGGQKTYDTRVAIGDEMSRIYASIFAVEYTTSNLRITPLSHDHAVLSVDFTQRVETTAGQKIAIGGTTTGVIQRESAGWKFLIGHSTAVNLGEG